MGRRRLTNRVTGYHGETVTMTVRIRKDVADFIDSRLGQPDLTTRSECLQEAAALWAMVEEQSMNGHDE